MNKIINKQPTLETDPLSKEEIDNTSRFCIESLNKTILSRFTKKQAAAKLGISEITLSRILSGETKSISQNTFNKILHLYCYVEYSNNINKKKS